MELDTIKYCVLDLISPQRPINHDLLTTLDDNAWGLVRSLLRQHRLESLLYWRLTQENQMSCLPSTMQADLTSHFQQATRRALALQRELLLLHRILESAGIPYVALKGAFLAFHAYPHPALRALRDFDILVPRDQALAAYQALIDSGLQRMQIYPGNAEAALEAMHHLPPLRSPSGITSVELHVRVFHPDENEPAHSDLAEDAEFWERITNRPIAGVRVPFESATDLLLHMIVHGVYDHQFNNGPLLISDLAYLLARETIDWPLFWRLAEQRRQLRGCLLALQMTEHYREKLNITWPERHDPGNCPAPHQEAALLMLQDLEARGNLELENLASNQNSRFAKMLVFLRKAFPSKNDIAATYPVSAKSPFVYFWYLVKWRTLLQSRLPSYLRSLKQARYQEEMRSMRTLERWLSGG